MPDDVQGLSECTFPELSKLGYWSTQEPQELFTQNCVPFIERHPTVEELLRFHTVTSEQVTLKSDALPRLRRLSASLSIVEAFVLDDKRSNFTLESLAGFSATSGVLKSLEKLDVDRRSLKVLVVDSFDDLDSIAKLGAIFPSLELLFVPQRGSRGRTFGTVWYRYFIFTLANVFLG